MKLVLLTGAVVSVEVEQNGMGHGAAHPYGHAEAVHWLRAERRELRAEDAFTEGSRRKEMLARRCWTSLVRHFDGDVPFAKSARSPDLLKVDSAPSNWSFSPRGLTIGFPEYSVSPRSMPAGETTVGWDALKPYLRASFARPG